MEAGLIQLQQIPDEENRADILTKIITGLLGIEDNDAVLESDTVRDE